MKLKDLEFEVNNTQLSPIDVEVHLLENNKYVIYAEYFCDIETYFAIENVLTLGDKQFIKLGYKGGIFAIREKF
jgi:hypothetical protein